MAGQQHDDWDDGLPLLELVPELFYMQPAKRETISNLPAELVDAVASFVPQADLPAFALVDSRCRAVAIRHMYAKVVLQAILFRRMEPNEQGGKLPNVELSVKEILASVTIRNMPVLRRVLSNDDHIAAVKDLRIEGYPPVADLRPYFIKFVEHIWKNAPALTQMNHEWFPSTPKAWPAPSWSSPLVHLEARHICWWALRALEAPSVRRLTMENCTTTADKLATKDLRHITHFEYKWHDWKGSLELFNFDWIAESFPNLTGLRIGICTCWQNQLIPDKIYEGALCRLASNLPFLRTFVIGEALENSAEAEEHFVHALSKAQSSLREVRFEWRLDNGVSWRRHQPSRKMSKIEWTPDPMFEGRKRWWFSRFGVPEASRPEMKARWHQDGYEIPEERELNDLVFSIIREELSKDKVCQWATKAECDCIRCIF